MSQHLTPRAERTAALWWVVGVAALLAWTAKGVGQPAEPPAADDVSPGMDWADRTAGWAAALDPMHTGRPSELPAFDPPAPGPVIAEGAVVPAGGGVGGRGAGGSLVIVGTHGGVWDKDSVIYTADADGSNLTKVADIEGSMYNTDLIDRSPDGSVYAFVMSPNVRGSRNHIYRLRADGSGLTQLTREHGCEPVRFSPDGRRLAFMSNRVHGTPEVYVMNPDGSGQRRRPGDAPYLETFEAWSPDGRTIVYRHMLDGSGDDGRQTEFHALSVEDWTSKRLGVFDGFVWGARFSPDGKLIAFNQREKLSGAVHQLYLMNADGSGVRPLAPLERGALTDPQWSEGGQRVIFGSWDGIVGEDHVDRRKDFWLMSVDRDGRDPQRSTRPAPATMAMPKIGPTGRYVAYRTGTGREGDLAIHVWDSTTGESTRVLDYPAEDGIVQCFWLRGGGGGGDAEAVRRAEARDLGGAAQAALALGNEADAAENLTAALERDADNAELRRQYADLLLDRGRTADALPELKRAVAADPGDADTMARLAEVAAGQGELDTAARAARLTAELDRDRPEAWERLATVELRRGHGLNAAAAARAAQRLTGDPSPTAAAAVARLRAEAEQALRDDDPDAAVRLLRAAAQTAPADADTLRRLCGVLDAQGNPASAIAVVQAACRAAPDAAPPRLLLAERHAAMGEVEQAVDDIRAACHAAPDDPAAHRRLADALLARGEVAEAADVVARLLALEPGEAAHHATLARLYLALDRPADALLQARLAIAGRAETRGWPGPLRALAESGVARPREAEVGRVPDVVGLASDTAAARVVRCGLKPVFGDPRPAAPGDQPGTIATTDPAPGEAADAAIPVTLTPFGPTDLAGR